MAPGKCALFAEVHMAELTYALGPVGRLKVAGRRLIFEAILFLFKKTIHSLE